MKQTKEQVALSKFMSYVLRHRPVEMGLLLTHDGKATVAAVVKCHNATQKRQITAQDILDVVQSCEKQRYSLSEDQQMIWANQGHSINIMPEFERRVPPPYLYHGTATRNYESILAKGLVPGSRHHVHMSEDYTTAMIVGARHGKPIALKIDSKRMHDDGLEFFISANGVWLVAVVDPKYIFKPVKEC